MREAVRLRGSVGVVAVIVYLWSSSAAIGAVRHSLNRIWGVKRSRPFWRRKLLEVVTTLILGGILAALVVVSVGLSVLAELGWRIPLSGPFASFVLPGPLREAGTVALVFVTFLVVYGVLPNRPLRWQWLWPGALVAAVLFEGARRGAFWILARFAQHQLVYGSMAGIVVFMLWTYVMAAILLFGAEISRWRALSTVSGVPRPVSP